MEILEVVSYITDCFSSHQSPFYLFFMFAKLNLISVPTWASSNKQAKTYFFPKNP